ncbi:hypothetical protein BDZ89DRAFT_438413 [Hymenopellis radicata]|nr:hypothetical protein BDZ89DRAFT_438413 [Hymenopellis radicata]
MKLDFVLETGQVNKVKVRVTDRCASVPDCQPPFTYNVDFTPAAFQKLAPLSLGRLDNLHWEFIGEGEEDNSGTESRDIKTDPNVAMGEAGTVTRLTILMKRRLEKLRL